MPDINDTIATQVAPIRPPTPVQTPDIIGPITSLANLQYLQAHGAYEQSLAGFQQAKTGSYNAFGQAIAGGASVPDAMKSSNFGAFGGPDAQTMQNIFSNYNYQQSLAAAGGASPATIAAAAQGPKSAGEAVGTQQMQLGLAGRQAYAANPTPQNAAAIGPEAYSQAMTALNTQGEAAAKRLVAMGQIGGFVLGSVNPDGSLDPAVRQQATQWALAAGVPPQVVAMEKNRTDAQLIQDAQAWQTGGMTAEQWRTSTKMGAPGEYPYSPPPPGRGWNGVAPQGLITAPAPTASPPSGLTTATAPVAQPAVTGIGANGVPTLANPSAGPNAPAAPLAYGPSPAPAPVTSATAAPAPYQLQGVNPNARGMKNNNPGNLEDGPFTRSLPGYIGSDGRFAQFSSMSQGMVALDRNLQSYASRGISSPFAIASTWAPSLSAENGAHPADAINNPNAYGTAIANALGVRLGDQIDMTNPTVRAKVAQAIVKVENGGGGATIPSAAGPMTAGGFNRPLGASNVAPVDPNTAALAQAAALTGAVPPLGRPQTPTPAPAAAPAIPPVSVAPVPKAPVAAAPVAASTPPPGSAPAVTPTQTAYASPGAAAPSSAPSIPGVAAGFTPMTIAQKAEQEKVGTGYGELPAALDAGANTAKTANTILGEMLQRVDGSWQPGKWAPVAEDAREALQSAGKFLGWDTSSLDQPIASYQDYAKLAGNLVRTAAHEVGSRTGVQEMGMIQKVMPSTETSDGGIHLVGNQMMGMNDFAIAKQQAAGGWRQANNNSAGPMTKGGPDFQTYWNDNMSPAAFVFHRMLTENPAEANALISRMVAQPGGRATLESIHKEMTLAEQAGLM